MRARSLLSSLLLTVSVPALAATSLVAPIAMNDWHVAPMVEAGKTSPSYCAIATHYTNGPVVTFTRNGNGKGSLAIDFLNAEMEKGKRYAVTITAEGKPIRLNGTAISRTQIVLQTGINKTLNNTLSSGQPLTVSLDGTAGVYTLAGNTRAFFEFDHCLKALAPQDNSIQQASVLTPQSVTTERAFALTPTPVIEQPIAALPEPIAPVAAIPAPQIKAPQIVAPMKNEAVVAMQEKAPSYFSEVATPSKQVAVIQPTIKEKTVAALPEYIAPIAKPAPTPAPTPAPVALAPVAALPIVTAAATLPVAKPVSPVLTPPIELASIEPTPIASSILWDHIETPVTISKPDTQAFSAIENTPVVEEQLPIMAAPVAKIETPVAPVAKAPTPIKFDETSIATTAPAAGSEIVTANAQTEQTKSRLKSTLAQARAEAAGTELPPEPIAPAPVPAAKPVQAQTKTPVAAAPVVTAPVVLAPPSEPLFAPTASSIAKASPVIEKAPTLKIEEPVQAQTKSEPDERVPLAAVTANPPTQSAQEMQHLLFDNSPTYPISPKASTTELAPATVIEKAIPVSNTKVQREDLKTIAPKAKTQKATPAAPVKPLNEAKEEFVPSPVMPEVIPTLPPASQQPMSVEKAPQVETKLASVEKAPKAPAQLNTVTPSVGHPTATPFTVDTQTRQTASKRRVITFTPAPSSPISTWSTRLVEASSKEAANGFCLMESSFDNDTKLMIGQRPDGYSTLGINYGIDMLQANKTYTVNVQVDGEFEESFTGYAENGKTLVVQLGKKRSFFETLAQGEAVRVAMPGAASTFALTNLSQALDSFSSCVVGLGGEPITVASLRNDAIVPNDLVITSAIDTPPMNEVQALPPVPTPVAQAPIAPAPIAQATPVFETPVVKAPEAPAPIAEVAPAPVIEPAPVVASTNTQSILWDIPQETIATAPALKTSTETPIAFAAQQRPAASSNTEWSNDLRDLLKESGIKSPVSVEGQQATWQDGVVKGKATTLAKGDVLDVADAALAKAETSCQGTFSVQMGLPDTYGDITIQPMESKCENKGDVTVSTWVVQQEANGAATAVQMEAPRDQRSQAFRLRDKMLSILQKTDKTASTLSQSEKAS